jgi:hypothetical protein
MTRHRSRTRQFLKGLGMDAKQCGCLLTVQEGLEFLKLRSWRHWFSPVPLNAVYLASCEWRLRQLFEQFAADPSESILLHHAEIGIYTDRFVEGQLPLPHVPNVGAVQVR